MSREALLRKHLFFSVPNVAAEPVPARFREHFCVYGRTDKNFLACATIRAPRASERFVLEVPYVVLDDVWTHAKVRAQGYGAQMVRQAQESARRRGWAVACRPVAHKSGVHQPAAQPALEAFYRRLGWEGAPEAEWWVWWGADYSS